MYRETFSRRKAALQCRKFKGARGPLRVWLAGLRILTGHRMPTHISGTYQLPETCLLDQPGDSRHGTTGAIRRERSALPSNGQPREPRRPPSRPSCNTLTSVRNIVRNIDSFPKGAPSGSIPYSYSYVIIVVVRVRRLV